MKKIDDFKVELYCEDCVYKKEDNDCYKVSKNNKNQYQEMDANICPHYFDKYEGIF